MTICITDYPFIDIRSCCFFWKEPRHKLLSILKAKFNKQQALIWSVECHGSICSQMNQRGDPQYVESPNSKWREQEKLTCGFCFVHINSNSKPCVGTLLLFFFFSFFFFCLLFYWRTHSLH